MHACIASYLPNYTVNSSLTFFQSGDNIASGVQILPWPENEASATKTTTKLQGIVNHSPFISMNHSAWNVIAPLPSSSN